MNLIKKAIQRIKEKKIKDAELSQYFDDTDSFDDEEYLRVKNAKEKLIARLDSEKINDICTSIEMKHFLMEDHKFQYRDL